MKKSFLVIAILLVLSSIALSDYFKSVYLPLFHDQVQVERVYEMKSALLSGQFPVRFVGNLGYGFGYPLFNYYAPLPYFLAAQLSFLFDLIFATKLIIAIGFIAAGISSYFVSSKIWGKLGGLVTSILYLLGPYHAVQLYVRGSVGELFAYALLPLVLYSVIKISKDKLPSKNIILCLSVAAFFTSHAISIYMAALLMLVPLIVIGIISIKINNFETYLKNLGYYILTPFLLASFFLIPAFSETRLTQLSLASANNVKYDDHFVDLSQLWSSPWGFGGSAVGTQDGLSFMIGKFVIILSVVVIILFLIRQKRFNFNKFQRQILISLSVLGLITLFLMTKTSNFIWQNIPYMQLIQFPWRFLSFINLFLSLIAGGVVISLVHLKSNRLRLAISTIFIFAISFYQIYPLNHIYDLKTKYFNANGYYQKNSSQIIDIKNIRYEASKISDEYMPKGLQKPTQPSQISEDQISCFVQCSVKNAVFLPDQYSFDILIQEDSPIFLQKSYFPDFRVKVDERPSKIQTGPSDMLGVYLERGQHHVQFQLHNTRVRTISNALSVFALILLLVYHWLDYTHINQVCKLNQVQSI